VVAVSCRKEEREQNKDKTREMKNRGK
jgi:hypothetical protein